MFFYIVCHELSKLRLDTAVSGVSSRERCYAVSPAPDIADEHPFINSELSLSKPSHPKQQRQKHEKSSSTQIPTALVTPLPGTSPPQLTYDHIPDCPSRHCMRFEPETTWYGRKVVEQSMVEELHSNDNTVELIEKWKGLIDMKDIILKQKNLQIERYEILLDVFTTCYLR